MSVLKDVVQKNQKVLQEITESNYNVIDKLAFRMRSIFNFFKKPIKVYGEGEVLLEENWLNFVAVECPKLNDGSTEVCVILSLKAKKTQMTFITQTKIGKIHFSPHEEQTQWTDDSEPNVLEKRFDQIF